MPHLFTCSSLCKTFSQGKRCIQALSDLSLSVRQGGLTALVGPDGAGKTTFLRLAAGLLEPSSGTLAFDGQKYRGGDEELLGRIGYMPQKFGLYEDLSVQENLDLYADLKNVPNNERPSRYRELLEMCAMEPFTSRLAGRLSGGMKQKLGLICTLVAPPELLLLDEPTVGVDPLSRRELWEIVKRLTTSRGMAVIVSTSYLNEAEACDEVLLLHEGRTLAHGTPAEIRAMTSGLAFLLPPFEGEGLRHTLARLEEELSPIDCVPEGGKIRLVTDKAPPGAEHLPARLEDSFMLLLKQSEEQKAERRENAGEKKGQKGSGLGLNQAGEKKISTEPVIVTEHVFRRFGDFIAVNDVSFKVMAGEVFGLLGPNGAGKTTTFRMLCGLLPPSSGTLMVAGHDLRTARHEARRRVGYVAQKFSLYAQLTVRENLEFFAGAYGLYGRKSRERQEAVIEDFSLAAWVNTPAGALPGGWQRSLAMAAGLLHEPDILFLDEPTSGADPLSRRTFWRRIGRLSEEKVTVIVTTHFMEEAEYCDHIIIQDAGVCLALGTPAEIRAQAGGAALNMEEAFIAIVEKARAQKLQQDHTVADKA